MLFVRSAVHACGYICLIHSLKFISPVSALCLQGTMCVMNSSVIRMRRACFRQREFGFIVPALMGSVFCLVIAKGYLRDGGLDIVEDRNSVFEKGMTFAVISGICLGFVGRASQSLAKKHLLPHESFMAFYESLLTCCLALISLIPMQ
jgi:hypothetical protein